MWIKFEPMAKEDSPEFVCGSHCSALYDGSSFDPNDDTAPICGTLPRLPKIEADRGRWNIVSWAVDPGDVLIFYLTMLHGGEPIAPGRRRRTLSPCFLATTPSAPHCSEPRASATATISIGGSPVPGHAAQSGRRAIRSGIRGFPRFARALR
jgi:hypothetical protein